MTDGYTFTATSKAADAPDIEPGLCDALFEGVDKKFIEGGQFGDGDRLVWMFTLVDDDGQVIREDREDNPNFNQPIVVDGLTSMSTNVLSKTEPKAVRYLKSLMTGDEFEDFKEGKGIPATELIGRKAQVDIAVRDSGWPTIVNVLPARKRRAGRATASTAE
jgi:hypothetical protein